MATHNTETAHPRTHLDPPATDAASVELLHRVLRVPRVFHQDEGEPYKTQFNIIGRPRNNQVVQWSPVLVLTWRLLGNPDILDGAEG